MARRDFYPVLTLLTFVAFIQSNVALVLTPPYFNLAEGRNITATATCGEIGPERYCRLTGATGEKFANVNFRRELIQGQLCDLCDPSEPTKNHIAEYAIDQTERWWQSPPLSRGKEFNKVNLEVHFGQEFHVAYVIIKMANSPRPGVWVLERSTDFGETWKPWQYFADTPSDCMSFFNVSANQPIKKDDDVICSTYFSKVVPLEDGEIVVSLVNNRPSANNFSFADDLQEWTKATDVRMNLLRTKTLLGHLMALARQDPTVTRRYYYSIKDISIGGRCVCNGHAESCDNVDNEDPRKLVCKCQHNTCGAQCEYCCPGFTQKKWQVARADSQFVCEPCECNNHSEDCYYDEEVAMQNKSMDIHGNYEGGGVCQNCRDNTRGINCDRCVLGFYRPDGYPANLTDSCQPCKCDLRISTGECEPDTGRCFCRVEFTGLDCDECSVGYYDYPECKACDCSINGTEGGMCTVAGGQCPCKSNYDGRGCDMCASGFYNYPECEPCTCDETGSSSLICDLDDGSCVCYEGYAGQNCDQCDNGYYGDDCEKCTCDPSGTVDEICTKEDGVCLCKPGYAEPNCASCVPGYFGFPNCTECGCDDNGSHDGICDSKGQCQCKMNFVGLQCNQCRPGNYRYPDCVPCGCDLDGSRQQSCNLETGQCECYPNFMGMKCDACSENFYNFPICEECNCNPAGAKEVPGYPLGGCGSVPPGQLCECKDQVIGRICDTCKPGAWNLQQYNAEGCEVCQCYEPGTVAGINVCHQETGQCMCKVDVGSQNCRECADGFYNLQSGNLFGCTECDCDMGGSVSPVCDRNTGQCRCQGRVTGRRCDEPIQTHFFPTLHQLKYEIEDGRSPTGHAVKYAFNESNFANFSWKGYAILHPVQPEVNLDFYVQKPSVYLMIFRFINNNEKAAQGRITLTPEYVEDVPIQISEVLFHPTTDPDFTTVAGEGETYHPFVLDPGRWTAKVNVPENILLDYFVLIPQRYYEGTVLQYPVQRPCGAQNGNSSEPCLHFNYLDANGFAYVQGSSGYYTTPDGEVRPTQVYTELKGAEPAYIDFNQNSLSLDIPIPEPGLYVITLNYFTPDSNSTQEVLATVSPTLGGVSDASISLHRCTYSVICRQVLKDANAMVAVFNINEDKVTLTVTGDSNINAAIDSAVAIPYSQWSVRYVRPSIKCIYINGVCIDSGYSTPPSSIRIEVESSGNDDLVATDLPEDISDKNAKLIKLNESLSVFDVNATVLVPTQYVILMHYYMPSSPTSHVNVYVHNNGRVYKGVFKPTYCPSISGCRGLVYFDKNNYIVDLRNVSSHIVFNTTGSEDVWLDYFLMIPAKHYDKSSLDYSPIDNSGKFIADCFKDKYDIHEYPSEFCRHAIFSVTTDFNEGSLRCNCDVDGSVGFSCESYGGQCPCKENIIGRTCSACRPGYFGFPDCHPCDCPVGLCDPFTGTCDCPPRVTGDKCERCEDETYGYDSFTGCQECNCVAQGVVDGNLNCNLTTGQCDCLPNVGGMRCDHCLLGFHSFPWCRECDCDHRGTIAEICDQDSGFCICKEHVTGLRCSEPVPGAINLQRIHPLGATKCFCFGISSRCRSAVLFWSEIKNMTGWEVKNAGKAVLTEHEAVVEVIAADREELEAGEGEIRKSDQLLRLAFDDKEELEAAYFVLPDAYLGHRLSSYGGLLRYKLIFQIAENENDTLVNYGTVHPDVIIKGNNMTVYHMSDDQPAPNTEFYGMVPIAWYEFRHSINREKVTREQFMMILSNVEAIHIRASYYRYMAETRLSEVTLETAIEDDERDESDEGVAGTVEHCHCPQGYKGLSCEECDEGYWRPRTKPYLGICHQCDCNGHTDKCDLYTGICMDCKDNTTGDHCHRCLPGYHGDPYRGACEICACPLPIPSNNFADTCHVDETGTLVGCYSCEEGYYGRYCERCAAGYFGRPDEVGETCSPCNCSGNIDLRNPYSCDHRTGACLECMNNTAGQRCEICADWFFGDALLDTCERCDCNYCGSEDCDRNSGGCNCKPNVVGDNCDECAPDYYGYDTCQGCQPCECGNGSLTTQCDLQTGLCVCSPGVIGEKCDQCAFGHWNIGPEGCQQCTCMTQAAISCDALTGECICLPGVGGVHCDTCLPRWLLVPGQGCKECDYCVHILLDDMDYVDRNITIIHRELETVSIGVASNRRLSFVNDTVNSLRTDVEEMLDNMDNLTADPLRKAVDYWTENITSVLRLSDVQKVQGVDLTDDVKMFIEKSATAESAAHEGESIVDDAVAHVKLILERILSRIQVTNINVYIKRSDEVVDEISGRNFDKENTTNHAEQEEADSAYANSQNLSSISNVNKQRAMEINEFAADVVKRLEDLQNHTRLASSNSSEAQTILLSLKEYLLKELDILMKQLETDEMETEELRDAAYMLLDDTNLALEKAESSFLDVEVKLSQLEEDVDSKLVGKVEHLEGELDSLYLPVNQSIEHANNINKQAKYLESTFMDTRESAANAVQAANAFQGIVDAINDAYDASKAAVSAAEDALGMSGGVGNTSAESDMRSKELSVAADEQFNLTQIGLKLRLAQGKSSVAGVKLLNEDVSIKINELNNGLFQLPSGQLKDRSDVASQVAVDAQQITEMAAKKVDPIVKTLVEDKMKMKKIPELIHDYHRESQQIETQIDDLRKNLPSAAEKIEGLQSQAERSTTVGSSLSSNIAQLRESIDMARNEANRIRVALKLNETTRVTLRNPPNIDQAGSYNKVSLFFKTTQPDALLMYTGPEQPPSQLTPDFMSLELRNAQIVFKFNLGSSPGSTPAAVVHPSNVSDNKWHEVIAERIGKVGSVTVRTEDMEDLKVSKAYKGTFSVLELDPLTTKVFIGGPPDSVQLPPSVTRTPFVGVVEDVSFEDKPLGVWNFVDGEDNTDGAIERDVLKGISSNGFMFNGKGYVILSRKSLRWFPNKKFDIFLTIKTFSENGLLIFMRKDKDFMSLEMKDGYLLFQYDLGSGRAVLQSTEKYNNGQWHTIQASRIGSDGALLVGGITVARNASIGKLTELSITDNIFIGGYNEYDMPVRDVGTNYGFEGCIKDVEFDTTRRDLNENIQAKGVIPGCPEQVARVASFSYNQPGFMRKEADSIGYQFDMTLKMKTVENESLLMYAANEDQDSAFSLAVVNGRIIVSSDPGKQMTTLSTKVNTYNDGLWHYISIMKDGLRLKMNVDDTEMVETTAEGSRDTQETGPVMYFGGVPPGFEIAPGMAATTTRTIGCIGDVTLNGNFFNFITLSDSNREGVSLAGCFIPDEDEREHVRPTDETKPTTEEGQIPPPQCELQPNDDLEDLGEISGEYFGSSPLSRLEYKRFPARFRTRGTFELQFKTTASMGTIFYIHDRKHVDFIGLWLEDGKINFGFNCGSGSARVTSAMTYNDGKWHTVVFRRNLKVGDLIIDDLPEGSAESKGGTRTVNVIKRYYIGGLAEEIKEKAKNNLGNANIGFVGCLKNLKLNKKPFGPAAKPVDVKSCYEAAEIGTYFYRDGGNVKLFDDLKVGKSIDFSLEIKPRTMDGVIFAVHSTGKDFVMLQLVNGQLVFSMDNGKGIYNASTENTGEDQNAFCDGKWHRIEASKMKNIAVLTVDGVKMNEGISEATTTAADTDKPFYVGGVPSDVTRGILTDGAFLGCIRNFKVGDTYEYLSRGVPTGNVEFDTCPAS